jgi:NAD(P)-dependent dehydrogenase (short-subunit alcohol dehydrogenase family)
MTNSLDGKAVIITGAGQGLGRAYAVACAREGAAVVVNDVDAAAAADAVREIEQEGGTATATAGSVASWADSRRLVEVCGSRHGRLDGFVANAAVMYKAAPWDESEERLRAIAEVNVLGVQFGVANAMRAMADTGRGGSIVTVVSGAQFGILGMSAYGATKGAVNAMTLNWAIEGADRGIRVNAVSPVARTKMTLDHTSEDPLSYPVAEAITPVVVSLLSDATTGVTGRVIRFDGELLSSYEIARSPIGRRVDWTPADVTAALTARFGFDAAQVTG